MADILNVQDAFDLAFRCEKSASEELTIQFWNMYDDIKVRHAGEINELLEGFTRSLRNVSQHAEDIFKLWKIEDLLVPLYQIRKTDSFEELRSALLKMKDQTNLKKIFPDIETKPFFEPGHWYQRFLGYMIGKLNVSQLIPGKCSDISDEIICMLYKYESKTELENVTDYTVFEKFSLALKEHIPLFWNICVYAYYIAGYEGQDVDTRPKAKSICEKMICTLVLEKVNANVSGKELRWFQNEKDFKSNWKQVDNYFSSGDCFRFELENALKGRVFRSDFKMKLCNVYLVTILIFLRNFWQDSEQKSEQKHEQKHEQNHEQKPEQRQKKVSQFLKLIGYTKKTPLWSMGVCCFNQPTDEEKNLIEFLGDVLKRKITKHDLFIFSETEQAILNNDSTMSKRIQRAEEASDFADNKKIRNDIMPSLLFDLVYEYDNLKVEFSPENIPDRKQTDFRIYILECLKASEKCFLEALEADPIYRQDVLNKNHGAVRKAVKYRFRNIDRNTSAIELYVNVLDTARKHYWESDLKKKIPMQDVVFHLTSFAWKTIKGEHATLEYGGFFPGDENECRTDEIFLSFAAIGFADEYEDKTPEEMVSTLCEIFKGGFFASGISSQEDHLNFYVKPFLTFATSFLLSLSVKKRNEVVRSLCDKIEESYDVRSRLLQKMLIITLHTILIDRDNRLDLKSCRMVLSSIFRRVLYPDQFFTLEKINEQEYLRAILEEQYQLLRSPQLTDSGKFPSAYYLYIYSANHAAEYKKKKEKCFFSLVDKKLCLDLSCPIKSIDDFYQASLLIAGVSWRVSITADTKSIKIPTDFFKCLFETAYDFWEAIDKDYKFHIETATQDLLKLTWGTQFLLTAFADFARASFFKMSHFFKDETRENKSFKEKFLEVVLWGDIMQKLHNEEHQRYIAQNTIQTKKAFWLVSGSIRASCLPEIYKQMKENSENITFFANHKDVAEKYCEWLLADLRLEHKRFYTMATRLLSYTDFYKVIDRKELYLDKEHFKNLRIFEDQFLPYDNIGTYFKDICGE